MSVMDMESDELDELHESILDELAEGRATPSYLADQTGESRQLVSSRLRDLMMGGHVEKIHKGLYELQSDPRGGGGRGGNLDTAVMLIEDAQTTIPFVEDRVPEIEEARDELNAWLNKHG